MRSKLSDNPDNPAPESKQWRRLWKIQTKRRKFEVIWFAKYAKPPGESSGIDV